MDPTMRPFADDRFFVIKERRFARGVLKHHLHQALGECAAFALRHEGLAS